jgi:hypothetical protein
VAPAAFVQVPPQQPRSVEHASPCWLQNDGGAQKPSLQSFEQHSLLPPSGLLPHGLPEVLHVLLSGVHLPASHLPPQHSPSPVQAALSATHCFAPHFPPMHAPLQQSVFAAQASSGDLQAVTEAAQTFVVRSQLREPHSRLLVQAAPAGAAPPASAAFPLLVPPSLVGAPSSLSLPHPLTKWIGSASIAKPRPRSSFFIVEES